MTFSFCPSPTMISGFEATARSTMNELQRSKSTAFSPSTSLRLSVLRRSQCVAQSEGRRLSLLLTSFASYTARTKCICSSLSTNGAVMLASVPRKSRPSTRQNRMSLFIQLARLTIRLGTLPFPARSPHTFHDGMAANPSFHRICAKSRAGRRIQTVDMQ